MPVFANTTARNTRDDPHAARHLLADQLAQPVEFVAEIENMYQSGVRTFLEVGPGNSSPAWSAPSWKAGNMRPWPWMPPTGKRSGMVDLARAGPAGCAGAPSPADALGGGAEGTTSAEEANAHRADLRGELRPAPAGPAPGFRSPAPARLRVRRRAGTPAGREQR